MIESTLNSLGYGVSVIAMVAFIVLLTLAAFAVLWVSLEVLFRRDI
jgi:hypothetical protein